jgi:hypothetical protein
MINKIIYYLIGLSLFLSACKKKEQKEVIEESATYTVTFQGEWSSTNHPNSFPNGDHFSKIVGLTHPDYTSIAQEGGLASAGIKSMAETGSTSPLTTEMNAIISNNMGQIILGAGNIPTGITSESIDFTIQKDVPVVSLVTMVAPSPDWFLGTLKTRLYYEGKFIETLTVDAVLYDAGTDDGVSFTSANSPTNPQVNISKLVSAPLGNGASVVRLGKFTFVKK